jgi:hypothetical protein
MTEKEIQEKYHHNCKIIGEAVYRNSLNDQLIRHLIQENIKIEEAAKILKGKPSEDNTPVKP